MAREIRFVQWQRPMHRAPLTHLTPASEGRSQAAVARLAEGIEASRPARPGLASTDRQRQ